MLNHIGRKTKMPPKTLDAIDEAINQTKNNTGLVLTFAFDYGAIEEIVNAINDILTAQLSVIDEKILFNYLYTKNLPDVDLMIRCGGKQRLSNFLLFTESLCWIIFY